ncbi:MAG TPA: hypothetical protein PKD86_07395 [Gemmatales bacterium]|nr:hypothetical protein [Gemmatales bacterium]HMP59160.1 hypothetical protein [Gemmatales bacterium]
MVRWARCCLGVVAMAGLLAATPRHAVFVKAQWQAGQLRIEGFYDDDLPAVGAKVIVQDSQGQTVAEGTTNDQGVWRLAWTREGTFTVRLDAGDGHRAHTTITIPRSASGTAGASAAAPFNPTSAEAERVTDEQQSRTELTASRWPRAVLGVALIAVLAVATRQVLRHSRSTSPPASPAGQP